MCTLVSSNSILSADHVKAWHVKNISLFMAGCLAGWQAGWLAGWLAALLAGLHLDSRKGMVCVVLVFLDPPDSLWFLGAPNFWVLPAPRGYARVPAAPGFSRLLDFLEFLGVHLAHPKPFMALLGFLDP